MEVNKRKKQIISNELRKLIIDKCNSGDAYTYVAKTFKVNADAVKKCIKRFKPKEEYLRRKLAIEAKF